MGNLEETIAYCRRITKASRSNFYYAFLLLPRAQSEAIQTVYAFCRCVDDAVDQSASPEEAKKELDQWREQMRRCLEVPPSHPLLAALAGTIRKYNIPLEYFEELISGMEMDLHSRRYATFEDLRLYCYRAASVVGLICLKIFGTTRPEAEEHAVHQGLAFQLTNILRDLRADAERGRIYLPLEDLERFRYTEKDLMDSVYNPPFVEMMAFQCARARAHYEKARACLPPQDRRRLLASEVMAAVYYRILREIERRNYDVFTKKIALPRRAKLALALRTWLSNRLGL